MKLNQADRFGDKDTQYGDHPVLTINTYGGFQRSMIALLIGASLYGSALPVGAETLPPSQGESTAALLASGFKNLETGNTQLRVIYSPLTQSVINPAKELMIRKGASQLTCAFLLAGTLKKGGISADYSNFSGAADFTCEILFWGNGAEFYGDAPAESGSVVLKGLGILLNVGLAVAGAQVGNALGGPLLAGGLGAQGAALGHNAPTPGAAIDTGGELYRALAQRGQLFGDKDRVILQRICQPTLNQCGFVLGVASVDETGKPPSENSRVLPHKAIQGAIAAMNLVPAATPTTISE